MLSQVKAADRRDPTEEKDNSQQVIRSLAANELVFAVVGAVGSGTSEVAEALSNLLEKCGYTPAIIKAKDVISDWAARTGFKLASQNEGAFKVVESFQDAGDAMRLQDHAAIASALIGRIRNERARQMNVMVDQGDPVEPDGQPRAFILDSLRHPQEVSLLRHVYHESFCLVGVVCDEVERKKRLQEEKFRDAGADALESFMKRDEGSPEKHGQRVSDTFHLADFFVDNSAPRFLDKPGRRKEENPAWTVSDDLGRLVDILTHRRVIRPKSSETGMFHAFGAKMRSACLSRQVGAALLDRDGNLVSTGSNEVPRAGGGVYGGFSPGAASDQQQEVDFRCFVHTKYCSNTREQNQIIAELIHEVSEFAEITASEDLIKKIRKTRIGQLIEFSRAVHAEMDAILSAARQGVSPVGGTLFVTTFPCHNCARHIVTAGIDEVQFIEPYLKSKALTLHDDAITTEKQGWIRPSSALTAAEQVPKTLFAPFTGVAPRLYRRAFFKDRDLKDGHSGNMIGTFGPAEGHGSVDALRVSYAQVEARLIHSLSGQKNE